MQAIIASLLMGMEQDFKEGVKLPPGESREPSPFFQLLLKEQGKVEKEEKMVLLSPGADGEKAVELFLEELLGELLGEIEELVLEISGATVPELKAFVLGDEGTMDLLKDLLLSGEKDKAREVVVDFLQKNENPNPGPGSYRRSREISNHPGELPKKIPGKEKKENPIPGSRIFRRARGISSNLEEKGHRLPGKEKGKKPDARPVKNEADPEPKNPAKEILKARGKLPEKENQKPLLKAAERSQPQKPEPPGYSLLRKEKVGETILAAKETSAKNSAFHLFSGERDGEGKPVLLQKEAELLMQGDRGKSTGGIGKPKSPYPDQENTGPSEKSSFPMGKRPSVLNSREMGESRFDLFSGSQRGNQGPKNGFQSQGERPDFNLEILENPQRMEARATGTGSARTLTGENRPQEVFQQIVDQARLTLRNREEGTMEIKLRPEYLGGLRMRVALEDGQLRAHFQVENHLARDILENNLTNLRDTLSREGFTFDDVDVNVQGEGSEGSGREEGEPEESDLERDEKQEPLNESLYSVLERNQVDYRV